MINYPFNTAGVDPKKLISYPYIPNIHPGTDYALLRRAAILATAEGRISLTNSTEDRNWLANTKTDPYLTQAQKLLISTPAFKARSLKTADYGKFVKVDHGKDQFGHLIETLYAHLDEVVVQVGDRVTEGQLIGYSDNTGNSTGNHLHYEIRKDGRVVDPATFDYNFTGQEIKESQVYEFIENVTVSATRGLNVRTGPGTNYPVSKSTVSPILKKGDSFKVVGYVEGENVDGNNIWWLSWRGNFVWSGGTIIPDPVNNFIGGSIMAEKQSLMDEKTQLEKRNNEIVVMVGNLREEQVQNDQRLVALSAELSLIEQEPESAVEDTPETVESGEIVEASPQVEVTPAVDEPTEIEPVEAVELTPEQVKAKEQLESLESKKREIDDLMAEIKERAGL